jgi:SAM-dependent methyltransferase
MRLLRPSEVLRSDIVANRTMNRERGLHGINSYTRELDFDPIALLTATAQARGVAAWLDVCCGEGRALVAAATLLSESYPTLDIRLIGIDLVGPFAPSSFSCLEFTETDAAAYAPPCPFDLITCVHGLHYLGDKLGFLEKAYGWLKPGGLLISQLDPANVRAEGYPRTFWSPALRRARTRRAEIQLRSHRLRIEKTDAPLDFGAEFAGAAPSSQPNYTGIVVMDSWYRSREVQPPI